MLSPEGYDSLYIKRYGEFIAATHRENRPLGRSDAMFDETLPKDDTSAKRAALNILGVTYVLDKDTNPEKNGDDFPKSDFKFFLQEGNIRVYKAVHVLSRAGVFYNTMSVNNDAKILPTLFAKTFPYQTTLLVEGGPHLSSAHLPTPAHIISYQPNTVEMTAHADQNGVLFFSDVYYPGWSVWVDGKKEKLLRADYAFRAVSLSKGDHDIKFVYLPFSFFLGIGISSISFIIVVFLFFRYTQWKR